MFHYLFNIVNWSNNLVHGFPSIHGNVRIGTILADVLGIIFGAIVPITCLVIYFLSNNKGAQIISIFIFLVCFMTFVHMFPAYVGNEFANFFNNLPIWIAILSLTFSINDINLPLFGITKNLGLLINILGYVIYVIVAFCSLL